MKSNDIFDLIENIAATSSKNEKQALVSKYKGEPQFVRVLVAALNPMITYGIAKVPVSEVVSGGIQFTAETWQLLDDLASRKLSGGAARLAVINEMDRLCAKSAELLRRIIRKDLRAGFSESTVNKAIPKTIPDFPYMRCCLPKDAKLAEWPWEKGVFSQKKADGMFSNVDHEEGGLVRISSRQGNEFPLDNFGKLVAEVRGRLAAGFQYHGEITVKRNGATLARQIGNGILNSVLAGGDFGEGEVPVYQVWDAIPPECVVSKGKCSTKYRLRLAQIAKSLKETDGDSIELIPTRPVFSLAAAYAHAVELMKKGEEGTVVKHPDLPWGDGTSKYQVKLKLEFEVDLQITGIVPGKEGGKNEGRAGSFATKTSDDKLRVDVTVKNEDLRNKADANPEDFIGRIIAVTANDIMQPSESSDFYSLFLPRMTDAGYRTDKTEADDLDRVLAQKEAAIFGESLLKEAA